MVVKAIVQKSTNTILIAQTDDDLIDFLFGMLRIPLGRVIFLLGTEYNCFASFHNLYDSVANLEVGKHLKSQDLKNILLKPQLPPEYPSKNQIFSLIERQTPAKCCYSYPPDPAKQECTGHLTPSMSQSYGTTKCIAVRLADLNGMTSYVKGPGVFMVTDDLVVTPSSGISTLSFLTKLKIEVEDIKEMVFDIGIGEALSILKASVTSTSALTNGLMPILMKQRKQ